MNTSLIGLGLVLTATAITLTTAPVAFALPSTQQILAARPPGALTSLQAAAGGLGNVVVTVPAASIGPRDSGAAQLQTGRSYSDTFLIWVAPSAPSATMQVKASGAAALHCSSARLHVGVVNLVGCKFRTTAEPSGKTSIAITVDVDGYPSISHSFVHDITS